VVDLERRRLNETNRPELARCVRWVAKEEGDGAGYDVLSFDDSSQPRLIEVKTTNGSARTPFYLSRNECEVASEKPDQWRIYRVHLFASEPAGVHDCAPAGSSAAVAARGLAGIILRGMGGWRAGAASFGATGERLVGKSVALSV